MNKNLTVVTIIPPDSNMDNLFLDSPSQSYRGLYDFFSSSLWIIWFIFKRISFTSMHLNFIVNLSHSVVDNMFNFLELFPFFLIAPSSLGFRQFGSRVRTSGDQISSRYVNKTLAYNYYSDDYIYITTTCHFIQFLLLEYYIHKSFLLKHVWAGLHLFSFLLFLFFLLHVRQDWFKQQYFLQHF